MICGGTVLLVILLTTLSGLEHSCWHWKPSAFLFLFFKSFFKVNIHFFFRQTPLEQSPTSPQTRKGISRKGRKSRKSYRQSIKMARRSIKKQRSTLKNKNSPNQFKEGRLLIRQTRPKPLPFTCAYDTYVTAMTR